MFSGYYVVGIFQYPVIAVENCLTMVDVFSGYYVVFIFQYPVIAVETAFLRLVRSVAIMLCVYFSIL